MMYAVIRHYTGAPGFGAELTKRSKDVESIVSSVDGFVAYYLVQTTDGAASITVCEQKTGCDESTKRAAAWIKENMPNTKAGAPQIIAGDVGFQFASRTTKV
jgi:hypothetical protein